MSAPTNTGSTTAPAAVPATKQGPPPQLAAPESDQPVNVTAVTSKRAAKNFAPRAVFKPASATGNNGLSTMLAAVSDMSFVDVPYYEVTYKVPSFLMFFYTLGLMDNQMSHTKRFTDANPDWIFFVSRLYYSILLYYHTLKCQVTGGSISNDQTLFLEFIENNFDIKNAKIAGPLVPFFQSLAANAGPTKAYGNVVFGIPNDLGCSQNSDFLYANRMSQILPSIIFNLDQMMRYINNFAQVAPGAPAPVAATMNMTDQFFFNIYGVQAANGAHTRIAMKCPTARVEPQIPTSVAASFLGSSNVWRATLPFDPATNQSTYLAGNNQNRLSFDQILGFRGFGATANTNFGWFQQVGRIMQPYADFFRDSVSLGAISTLGIGVGYIKTSSMNDANSANALTADVTIRDVRYMPAGTPRYTIPNFGPFLTFAQHSEETLDIVTEQLGLLTQLDFDWTGVNGHGNTVLPGPIRGNTVVGPLEQRVNLRRSPASAVVAAIPNVISGYYHQPVALRFE